MGYAIGEWIIQVTQDQRYSQVVVLCYSYSQTDFRILYPQGIHQGGFHASNEELYGVGGSKSYPWIVLGIYWYVVDYGNCSRFSAPWFLEQYHNWYLWDGSIPLQWNNSLEILWGYSKGNYHHWWTSTRIQGSILRGEADGWCIELQHGKYFSPIYIYLVWVSKWWSGFKNTPNHDLCLCHTNHIHSKISVMQLPALNQVFIFCWVSWW